MTTNVATSVPTIEELVLVLLTPYKNGMSVLLEAGKARTGTVTSVFHKGQTATWRVKQNADEPQPHIQVLVGTQGRRVDDLSYAGLVDTVRALFETQVAPTPVTEVERLAAALAATPAMLQEFMASASLPNGADQTWAFDVSASDTVNTVVGTVTFLRGKPEPLTLPVVLELQHREIKGKMRARLMLSVGDHEPVRIKDLDDAIEAAYVEFDLHLPGQQRHLLIWDDSGSGLTYYALHTGTRISRLAQVAHGQYVNQAVDGDDPVALAADLRMQAFTEVFLTPEGESRYVGVSATEPPIVQRLELVTTCGFLA